MTTSKRNDLIYGQNWIQQGIVFRSSHGFNRFYESVHLWADDVMRNMARPSYGQESLWGGRRKDFLSFNLNEKYILVR